MNKTEVLQILQNYRSNLNQKLNQPGWTIWALKASLVTLIWIIIDTTNFKAVNYEFIVSEIFFLYFLYPLLNPIFGSEGMNRFIPNSSTFYFLKSEISTLGLYSILDLLLLGFGFFYVNFIDLLSGFFGFIFNTYCVLTVGVYASLIILHVSDIPLPKNPENSKKSFLRIFNLIFLIGIPLIISIGFFFNLKYTSEPELMDIKLGLLFFGLFYILRSILKLRRNYPIIESIDTLIDRLTFDSIEPQDAMKSMQIILHGLTLKDIIFPQLTSALNASQKHHTICEKINQTLDEFVKLDEEKKLAKELILKQVNNDLESLIKVSQDFNRHVALINKKVSRMPGSEFVSSDFKEAVKLLEEEKEKQSNNMTQLIDRQKQLWSIPEVK